MKLTPKNMIDPEKYEIHPKKKCKKYEIDTKKYEIGQFDIFLYLLGSISYFFGSISSCLHIFSANFIFSGAECKGKKTAKGHKFGLGGVGGSFWLEPPRFVEDTML